MPFHARVGRRGSGCRGWRDCLSGSTQGDGFCSRSVHGGEPCGDGQNDGKHGDYAVRRCGPRFHRDDGAASPGRNRNGAGRTPLRPKRATAPPRPGDHRHAAAGDRGDAARRRATSRIRRSIAELTPEGAEMNRTLRTGLAVVAANLAMLSPTWAGQAPGSASDPDVPVSHRDRVYAAEQFSNTVSVTDPADNKLLGVIRLGDPVPTNFSPLYRGQLLVHGMGFSPDHRTLAVVSIGSNSVTFIDTATNAIKHVAYVGRSPHEAFFTPDGKEVWLSIRGENYVAVLDGTSFKEKTRITVPNGPGMTIFSPDGKYGYVCSSFSPETVVITTAGHKIIGHVKQESPFCPDIAATPDGNQVWLTLKDVGSTMVFNARPPFGIRGVID